MENNNEQQLRFALYDMVRDRLKNEIKDWLYNSLVSNVLWESDDGDKSFHDLIIFVKENVEKNIDVRVDIGTEQDGDKGIIFKIRTRVF